MKLTFLILTALMSVQGFGASPTGRTYSCELSINNDSIDFDVPFDNQGVSMDYQGYKAEVINSTGCVTLQIQPDEEKREAFASGPEQASEVFVRLVNGKDWANLQCDLKK